MSDRVRSSVYVFIYGFLLSFSGWYFGYQIGMFNSFFEKFMDVVYPDITGKEDKNAIQGNLQLFLLIGGMASCLTAGYIIEKLGRYKAALLYMAAEMCILLLSLQVSLHVLYAVRFFHGYIACSWTFLAPLMMKEILPQNLKSLFSGMFYIFLTLGILTSYAFAFDTVGQYWRYVFLLPMVFDLPKLLAFVFVFRIESPKWICSKANDNEVRQAMLVVNLRKIYAEEDVDQKINLFMDEFNSSGTAEEVKVGDLLSAEYRLQFLLVIALNFLNQMTGINVLVMFSKKIFEQLNLENAAIITFIMGAVNTIGAITITILSQSFSKKIALVAGLGGQSVGYFIFLLGKVYDDNTTLIVAGIYVYIFSFAISLGGSLYPYQADILPASGIGIASITQWVIAALIGKFTNNILEFFGIFPVFTFFMVTGLLGGILVAGYGIVTENKSDAQIKQEFMEKSFMS